MKLTQRNSHSTRLGSFSKIWCFLIRGFLRRDLIGQCILKTLERLMKLIAEEALGFLAEKGCFTAKIWINYKGF